MSFFNTAANWGSGKPIAPGSVVGLCGTITSTLTAQASGSNGTPITILWQSGAKLSQPSCATSGCFNTNSKTDLVLDGGTNGIIENTDSGTGLGHTSKTKLISATGCDRCEIKSLTLQNDYVHSSAADNTIDQTAMNAIAIDGNGWSIHDNTIHDAGWAIYTNQICSDTVRIYNNNIYNVDHGWALASCETACTHAGPIYFYSNHVHDMANWDTTSNTYHHDGIHCYTSGTGGTPMHIDNFYIYNNRFDGDAGGHATAWVFLEGGTGSSSDSLQRRHFEHRGVQQRHDLHRGSHHKQHPLHLERQPGGRQQHDRWPRPVEPVEHLPGILSGGTYVNNAIGGCNQLINGSGTPAVLDYNAYAHCLAVSTASRSARAAAGQAISPPTVHVSLHSTHTA